MKTDKYNKEINWKTFSDQWKSDDEFREYYEIDRLMGMFTEALAEVMINNSWKQKDLAKNLGVSDSYLGRLLKGKKNVSLKTIVRMMLKLNKRAYLSVAELEDDFVPLKNHSEQKYEREFVFSFKSPENMHRIETKNHTYDSTKVFSNVIVEKVGE